MKRCAFFGHAKFNIYDEEAKERLKAIVVNLIEEKGVTEFYNRGKGIFDGVSSKVVEELKKEYKDIKLIQVLAYHTISGCQLPSGFDESIYLIEGKVLQRFAIIKTNELLVKHCDYIVSGVYLSYGGAYDAVDYAKRKKKTVIKLYKY